MELYITDRFKNRKIEFFNDFQINLVYNSIASTFSFQFYFDPFNEAHKELACVSHFHEAELWHNGELILTGFILSQAFEVAEVKKMASFSGYSKTGVLEDCEIPPSLYPLQSNNSSLKDISLKLLRPFKLKLEIDSGVADRVNKSFKNSTASDSQKIKDYLHQMAKQKNIVLTHNAKGELLMTEAKTKGKPVLDFDLSKGSIPGTNFKFTYNGQGMHSHIHMQGQASSTGGNAIDGSIKNPYVLIVYRPTTKSQTSGDDNDTDLALRRELSNELKNLTLTITTDRWEIDGKIIKPNNTITILAPELYIYVKTTFFIESINFTGNQESTTAVLNCVLPEVYTNEIPKSIYAGINLTPKPHI